MTAIRKLELLAFVLLFSAIGLSVAYGQEPIDFAKEVGANENLISELDEACKTTSHYEHCFGIGLSISNAETRMGKAKSSHGYFGRVASKDKSAYGFAGSYERMYSIPSKYNEGGLFYGYGPNKPAPTRYCMSEDSSNSKGYCPNGRNSFNKVYLAYRKSVLGDNIIEPPLSDNITKPVYTKTPKLTGRKCRQVFTAKEGQTFQLDNKMGRFVSWILNLKAGDKGFICTDNTVNK